MTPYIFLKGKDPSYWNSSSYGVLPQSFLDFTVHGLCLGVWNDIFSLQQRFCPMYSCEAVTEKGFDTEVLHMLSEIHHDRENWVPQCVELLSFWKVQCQKWPWHWYDAHGALCPNNLSVRKEVCDGPYVGHSQNQTLRVQWGTPWALALEECRSWWKGGSIRWVVLLDQPYYLHL